MRFATVFAVAASFIAVGAQDLTGIPTCALSCFAAAVPSSGCSLTDAKCQCTTGRDKIQDSITSCVPSKCSADDVQKITPAIMKLCESAGVTLSNLPTALSTVSGTGTAKATASKTEDASSSSSAAAEQTSNAAVANMAGMGAAAVGFAAYFL